MTETAAELSSKIGHGTEIPFGNENAERRAYRLPLGKTFHLYIVHSEEEIEEAIELCKNIESRFQLTCRISGREILFGDPGFQQLQYMMSKSVTILLLLSPAFFKDINCVINMELAVEMFCDRNFSVGIINVLLQDIDELPPLLKPYICIEAQKTCDIAAKINDTFCQTGIKLNLIDKLIYVRQHPSPSTQTQEHTHSAFTFKFLLLAYLYVCNMTQVRK